MWQSKKENMVVMSHKIKYRNEAARVTKREDIGYREDGERTFVTVIDSAPCESREKGTLYTKKGQTVSTHKGRIGNSRTIR
jgi:hypothetical protein